MHGWRWSGQGQTNLKESRSPKMAPYQRKTESNGELMNFRLDWNVTKKKSVRSNLCSGCLFKKNNIQN